ncbi:phosphatidylglycerophosphatase [Defluviimonas sp. 20V17]|uniref:Phosphatidylglycerophosphatase A n=1 Tax=Allgaiera indica TaxID=765699 RepID=A0AAN4URM4_9RHOB|nr:phosphatidylglycerophosphatase A [Allgaiera indica]KDB01837.1 phosphatidylglycerophosphatase [Defluviimonas sp. 20V17]GHE02442.1 phosphatidylglycerophosphatase A [Allgaiera indica]SDX29870.1 phosphatidylglycerophosphatase A [Allgaiera indica]
MSRAVAIFFGVGLLRPAPGTWGSFVALLIGWAIDIWLGFPALVLAFVIATAAGFWACARELAGRSGEDPSEIVIDEVAGQWLALLFPAYGFWMIGHQIVWPGPVFAFLLFRLFDIWKPWLVGRADRRHDAAGVMLDDLWAGLFAGIATIALAAVFHGPVLLWQMIHG